MLKKLCSFLLVSALCLSLAACGKPETAAPETPSAPVAQNEPVTPDKPAPVQEETPAASPAEETPEAGEKPDAGTSSVYEPERCETDALTWEFDADTGTLSVHGEGPMRDYSGEAPEWEPYKDQILAVSLDDGITSVGAYAFYNYLCLTEVRLPDSVEVIDVSAFDYDWELRSITIPASLKYVGDRAFYNTLLWEPEDLVFPEGCEYIGDEAFHSALKTGGSVSLPSTLKYLGERSFTNAYLSDFTVAEDNEFYCSENHAVYTKDMKSLLMFAPVTEGMSEFRIPDGVEKISAECFNVMQGVETVYIPASVTEIEEEAFFSTFDLKKITVDEANPNYRSENGLLLSRDGTLLLAWPDGTEVSELVIPDGVERLGAYLFYGRYDSPYTVVLPESVREIGTMSLPANMASLTLPSGLEKIDDYVFYEGLSVAGIHYNGTAADWEKIVIGENNTVLDSTPIQMS